MVSSDGLLFLLHIAAAGPVVCGNAVENLHVRDEGKASDETECLFASVIQRVATRVRRANGLSTSASAKVVVEVVLNTKR